MRNPKLHSGRGITAFEKVVILEMANPIFPKRRGGFLFWDTTTSYLHTLKSYGDTVTFYLDTLKSEWDIVKSDLDTLKSYGHTAKSYLDTLKSYWDTAKSYRNTGKCTGTAEICVF